MKVTFKAKIVAEADDKDYVLSITKVCELLKEGKMNVECPEFYDEPTIILTEKK